MIASAWVKQSIVTVLCLLGIPSYLSAPKPISISLDGESSITVPANRATIVLRIHSEGQNQVKVADEVRKTADEIISTLRPLAQVTSQSQVSDGPINNVTTEKIEILEAAIVDFSVTSFRSHSYRKTGSFLTSDTPQYEATIGISAEFRSFDALGILLAQISKIPFVTIRSLKWTLDATTRRNLLIQCREQAMVDALEKVHAYVRPLGMDKVRAIRVRETYHHNDDVVMADLFDPRVRRQIQPDEFASGGGEGENDEESVDTMKLEPRKLKIEAHLDGEFCAWKTGLEAWFRRGGVSPMQLRG
ncbi:hypothetical protein LTR84_006648 [Exophiala bonariae]|uniref:Uncharacterized protein n=1 Tax=Exophiala bonariae TaxID=1690606 RepID=A0AAV9N1A7_9EURO|nr:hypothetical protein LTR84_006648 [Exophiala bonariae]